MFSRLFSRSNCWTFHLFTISQKEFNTVTWFVACACKSTDGIIPPNVSQIANVIDLKFQGQTFGISVFCCNSKTVRHRVVHFYQRVHVDKSAYVVKFQSDLPRTWPSFYGLTFGILLFSHHRSTYSSVVQSIVSKNCFVLSEVDLGFWA